LVLILIERYKSINNDYIINGFVHARIKEYMGAGIEVSVFECCPKFLRSNYIIDGVSVTVGDSHDLSIYIDKYTPNTICPHFIDKNMIKGLEGAKYKPELFIFVHGGEALFWYERIFPKMFKTFKNIRLFVLYAVYNVFTIKKIRRFLKKRHHETTLVGVSQWMLDIAIRNFRCKGIKTVIIPNVIRTDLFKFEEKPLKQQLKILVLRSFDSMKYAPDIIVKVVEKLSKHSIFNNIQIHIIGEGKHWEQYTSAISHFPNVTLKKGFISQSEVAKLHKAYGIFLCPTRQDAQGVSMCEAMSSGLIPITLSNTAIPEFIPAELECFNIEDMVKLILNITEDSELFFRLSNLASSFIKNKCSPEKTTQVEINLFSE